MIRAATDFAALAAALERKAAHLAEARIAARRRADRGWHDARLLWPLFGRADDREPR